MVTKLLRLCLMMLLLSACSTAQKSMTFAAKPIEPETPQPPQYIALLLPQTGGLMTAGKAIQAGFMDAYQNAPTKPTIKVYDESHYDQAISDGANYIVGPLSKDKVAEIEQQKNSTVITIALNNPDKSAFNANVYEFGLSPIDEVSQIADKASADGHRNALLIYPAGSWGQNIANRLQTRWQKNNGKIISTLPITTLNNISTQMQSFVRTPGYDVIFMILQPQWAREIMPLLKYYGSASIPVYSTSLVYSGLMNSAKDDDLDGVIFCDMPLVLDKDGRWASVRQNMTLTQPMTIQQYIRLYGLGFDAGLLTQNFNQLASGISGATGNLYQDDQHILRKLTIATFRNGMADSLT